jgi:hypothetical protein
LIIGLISSLIVLISLAFSAALMDPPSPPPPKTGAPPIPAAAMIAAMLALLPPPLFLPLFFAVPELPGRPELAGGLLPPLLLGGFYG